MNKPSKLTSMSCALIVAAGLAASTVASHAQGAMATISEVTGTGGNFDYTIILQNTGSQSLNSFWYGWTTLGNNLSSVPTSAANSLAGWVATIDGKSIQWQNTASAPALATGQSDTFTFDSTSPLSTITTSPSGESVAFTTDDIEFNQGVSGQSTGVFSPTIVATPEPSSLGLLGTGLLVMAGLWRKAGSRPERRASLRLDA